MKRLIIQLLCVAALLLQLATMLPAQGSNDPLIETWEVPLDGTQIRFDWNGSSFEGKYTKVTGVYAILGFKIGDFYAVDIHRGNFTCENQPYQYKGTLKVRIAGRIPYDDHGFCFNVSNLDLVSRFGRRLRVHST